MATKIYQKCHGEAISTLVGTETKTHLPQKVLVQSQKETNGIILPYVEEKEEDTKERINSYNALDYKLENIIATGGIANLKEQKLSRPTIVADAELTDKILNQMTQEELENWMKMKQNETTTETEPNNKED